MNQHEVTGKSVIGVQQVAETDTDRYGIIDPVSVDGKLIKVNKFVEKPEAGTAPSNYAIMGRYILTPKIFDYLGEHELGAGGEIQLTDAIQKLNEVQSVYAYEFEGQRFDVGEKFGFIETTIEFALKRPELRDQLLALFEKKLQESLINKS